MKKLKYLLITLCAVVMCACCFSFKTNKVEAASIINEKDISISVSDPKIEIKDGQVGHSISVNLNYEAMGFLNSFAVPTKKTGLFETSYSFGHHYNLVIVRNYNGMSYNFSSIYGDSNDSNSFEYYDSKRYTTSVLFMNYNYVNGLDMPGNPHVPTVVGPKWTSLVGDINTVPTKFSSSGSTIDVFIPHQSFTTSDSYFDGNYSYYAFIYKVIYTKDLNLFTSEILAKSNQTYLESDKPLEEYLTRENFNSIKDEVAMPYLKALRKYTGEPYEVRVNYKEMNAEDKVVDKTLVGYVPEKYKLNKYAIHNKIINGGLFDTITGLSSFNVCRSALIIDNRGNEVPIDSAVVLQVNDTDKDGYPYFYSYGKYFGDYTVEYSDFLAKDFGIRVQSKSPDTTNFYNYIKTTDIVDKDGIITITFDYTHFQDILYNRYGWTLPLSINELSSGDITVNGDTDFNGKIYSSITIKIQDEKIVLSLPSSRQSNLLNLSVNINSDIEPPVEILGSLEYIELMYENGMFIENTKSLDLTKEPYLSILDSNNDGKLFSNEVYNFSKDFVLKYFDIVDNSLHPDILGDVNYYTVSSVLRNVDSTGSLPNYTFRVVYSKNTLLMLKKVVDNNSTIEFIDRPSGFIVFNTDDFENWLFDSDSDYYINKIEINSKYGKSTYVINNNIKFYTVTLTCDLQTNTIIPIDIYLSSDLFVEFDYFERYRLSPFVAQRTFSRFVPLSSVKNSDGEIEFNRNIVESLLGKSTSLYNDKILVDYVSFSTADGITYDLELHYTSYYVKKITYDGEVYNLNVPLTSYSSWCDGMGVNWSILALNGDVQYFDNTLALDENLTEKENRERLYGLFSVMIFEERKSDFNYYFANDAVSGCAVIFKSEKLSGSLLYNFFGKASNCILTSGLGNTGMALCELVNSDNKILHSYFYYIDIEDTTNPVISQSGSINPEDGDSFDNWFDEIKKGLEETFGPAFKTMSTIFTVFLVIIGGLFGLIIVLLIVRLCIWLFKGVGNIKPSNTSSGDSQTKPKKKPRKKTKKKKVK